MKKLLFFFFLSLPVLAQENPAQLLVHLLNYVSSDYSGAVDDNGQIRDAFEYEEQVDFSDKILEQSQSIESLKTNPGFMSELNLLAELVKKRGNPKEVAAQAKKLSQQAIQITGVETKPVQLVDTQKGKELYGRNCAQCHGAEGLGNGPSSGNFNPPPSKFTDAKLQNHSPFQFFNIIKLGVPGTAMAAFSQLTDEEIWNLSFYVVQLQKGKDVAQENHFFLLRAQQLIDKSLQSYLEGDLALARNLAISAYLDGIEPLEPKLQLKDAGFARSLERTIREIRKMMEAGLGQAEITLQVDQFRELLQQAGQLLVQKQSSFWFTCSVAFGIFLREAFEAALLLITLLGVVKKFGNKRAVVSIHIGWGFALGLGFLGWFLSGLILNMSGAQRELLEGGVSLFAVLILMYFGLWMHRKAEIGKWRDFIQQMVSQAMQKKSVVALGTVAFLGVFREVFETILFLRALLFETGSQQYFALSLGVFSAFTLVLFLSWWSVKASAKLPLRQLFLISSWIMFFLSFILLGKGIHALQETGLVPISEIGLNLHFDLLGLYPFYQTLVPQLLLLALIGLIQLRGKSWRLIQRWSVLK